MSDGCLALAETWCGINSSLWQYLRGSGTERCPTPTGGVSFRALDGCTALVIDPPPCVKGVN